MWILSLIPELGRFPRGGKGYPLYYSGLEFHKESDMTEWLSLSFPGKLDSYMQKNETEPLSYTTYKNTLKMD